MRIQIREGGAIARLYRWSRRVWESFGGSKTYGSNRSDICTVARTILVWMPLVLALNAVVILLCGYALFVLLQMLWFNLSTVGIIALILAGITLFAAMIVGIVIFGEKAVEIAQRSEMLRVGAAYITAKKQRICPPVEIVP